jgi:hypothetical protein
MSLGALGDCAKNLLVCSPYAHRLSPRVLYLRIDTFAAYGEFFRADGELQDFFPRFLDLRRDSFRAFSTNA